MNEYEFKNLGTVACLLGWGRMPCGVCLGHALFALWLTTPRNTAETDRAHRDLGQARRPAFAPAGFLTEVWRQGPQVPACTLTPLSD